MCDPMAKYGLCRVCGKEVNEAQKAWALRRFEQQTCSNECSRREIIQRFACCDKAEFLKRHCVCMYAFQCPTHGERHIGTHD